MVSLFSLFGGKKKAKTPLQSAGPSSSAASSASTSRRRSRSPPPPHSASSSSAIPSSARPVLATHKSGSSSSGNKLNTFSTSAGNSGTAKFLSLRTRSSGGASTLLAKGRGAQEAVEGDGFPVQDKGSPSWELPSLEFGQSEVEGTGKARGGLGLDNVGGPPKVSEEEWEEVQAVRFGMPNINTAWRLLGQGLRIARQFHLCLAYASIA